MELSHEDIVTQLLSKNEVLDMRLDEDNLPQKILFKSTPDYDLTQFLNSAPKEPNRWGEKYVFVK